MRSMVRPGGWLKSERGAVAVLVGLGVVAFIGFAALSLDVGRLFVTRIGLGNAADAAALGGAQLLPEDPAGAQSAALDILSQNGVSADDAQVTVEGDGDRIRVRVAGSVALALAPVLGADTGALQVAAVARVGAVTELEGVVPLGAESGEYTPGELYDLKLGAGEGCGGNFHALALGGQGACVYRDNLAHGYDSSLAVGDVLETEPGNMAGPTRSGVQERIEADPEATYEDFDRDSPRLVLVPLVDGFDECQGRGEVTIVGFAAFFLEDATGHGGEARVIGRFIRMVSGGGDIGHLDETLDCSLRGIDLLE